MGILSGDTLVPYRTKKRDSKTHNPFKYKKEVAHIACPRCAGPVQYRLKNQNATKVCPWCKNMFNPQYAPRGRYIHKFEIDSPTDWDEV